MAFEQNSPWLAAMLATVDQAVIAVDRQNHVLCMNSVAEQLTGWLQAEALGQDIGEVCHVPAGTITDLSTNPACFQDGWLIARDGTRVPIDGRVSSVVDNQADLLGHLIVFRDISERKRAQETAGHLQFVLESLHAIFGATYRYFLYVRAALGDEFAKLPEAACEGPIATLRRRAFLLRGVGFIMGECIGNLVRSANLLCSPESWGEWDETMRMEAMRQGRPQIEELVKWSKELSFKDVAGWERMDAHLEAQTSAKHHRSVISQR